MAPPDHREAGLVRHALTIAALVAASVLATGGAFLASGLQQRALEQARFDAVTEEAVADLSNRIEDYDQVLRSGMALLQVKGTATRKDWHDFVAALDIERHFAGLQGIGLAMRVLPGQLPAHEAAVRAEGFPDYRVWPAAPRDQYFPIVLIEPFKGRNLRAFGYDMWSDPIRHEAMQAAMDSGTGTLSGPVRLVQETNVDVQYGVLLYHALRRGTQTVGFVYSPLRLRDLFTAVLGPDLRHLCLAVTDQAVPEVGPIFANRTCRPGHFTKRRSVSLLGRTWVVEAHSTRALEHSIGSGYSGLLAGSGAAVGMLLAWLIASSIAENRRRRGLAQANAELAQARRQAEDANDAKSRFLAAASHDLRQPLQTLGIYLHLWAERSPAELHKIAGGAAKAFESTQRLLNSLMDVAALETGKLDPRIAETDLAELLAGIGREIRPEAEAEGLALRVRLRPVVVRTDPVMLERVVRNILHNAVKYTDSGAILLALAAGRDGVRIKVADSGPGIPQDRRDLIFEEFYQLGNVERDPRKGLGLGLATAARVSRLLGYRLELYSRIGRGSSFVVVVPYSPPSGTA
ncbi:MAG: CHASE domain-containing protein [Actinomycetota bacterium]